MASVIVNFRLDEDLKKEFDKICGELGVSMSTAYTMFVKKVVREKRIPFDVSVGSEFKSISEEKESQQRRLAAYEKLLREKINADYEAVSNE